MRLNHWVFSNFNYTRLMHTFAFNFRIIWLQFQQSVKKSTVSEIELQWTWMLWQRCNQRHQNARRRIEMILTFMWVKCRLSRLNDEQWGVAVFIYCEWLHKKAGGALQRRFRRFHQQRRLLFFECVVAAGVSFSLFLCLIVVLFDSGFIIYSFCSLVFFSLLNCSIRVTTIIWKVNPQRNVIDDVLMNYTLPSRVHWKTYWG